MHIHILGICGTFMGSLALLAKTLGYVVTGSDAHTYPPMSTQLAESGITLFEGYAFANAKEADLVVVGNAMRRGLEVIEALLDSQMPYVSGPEFLFDILLKNRQVLAVAGTHGKTTTTTLTAWILQHTGRDAGFLIGGVPVVDQTHRLKDIFATSSHLGAQNAPFVIEADEYDSAFFDKRSKFVHYRPMHVILNNLEFDHADIFNDLGAIMTQFHHLVRTIPPSGTLVVARDDTNLATVLNKGCWSRVHYTQVVDEFTTDNAIFAQAKPTDGGFVLKVPGETFDVRLSLPGRHNVQNALNACVLAMTQGVTAQECAAALGEFGGIKRRMETIARHAGIWVVDDFAHHPSAIAATLSALRIQARGRILAVIDPRSNTMQMGVHKATLESSAKAADWVFWYASAPYIHEAIKAPNQGVYTDIEVLIDAIFDKLEATDTLIIMSNGNFFGVHQKIVTRLLQTK